MKNEPTEVEMKQEPVAMVVNLAEQMETDINMDGEDDDDDDDPVVKEIDVFISKSYSNNIYILQYPIKPMNRNQDDAKFIGARIKPNLNKIELELEIDTHSKNYSKTKGEQICLNVDGRPTYAVPQGKQAQKEQKYFKSNLMDKIVYTSTNATSGQMNKLYHLGILKEDQLHLTSIRSILQMKPSFEYFDIYEKKVKDLKDGTKSADTDYSTEDEVDAENDKAELVTLKFSSQSSAVNQQQQQELDQNWINVPFYNINHAESIQAAKSLYCKSTNNFLKLDFTPEDFIRKLVTDTTSTANNQDKKLTKTE